MHFFRKPGAYRNRILPWLAGWLLSHAQHTQTHTRTHTRENFRSLKIRSETGEYGKNPTNHKVCARTRHTPSLLFQWNLGIRPSLSPCPEQAASVQSKTSGESWGGVGDETDQTQKREYELAGASKTSLDLLGTQVGPHPSTGHLPGEGEKWECI